VRHLHHAQIWDMANSHRLGYLDRLSFHKAMDLIGIAQQASAVAAPLHRPARLCRAASCLPTRWHSRGVLVLQ